MKYLAGSSCQADVSRQAALKFGLLREFVEEVLFDLAGGDRLQSQFQVGEHVDEFFAIDQLAGRRSAPVCFATCFDRKGACGDDDAFVCPPDHRSPEIPH